jgi:ComF family protein
MRITVDALADLVFPCQCSSCDAWDQTWLCPSCESQLTILSPSARHDLRSYSGLGALTEYSGVVKDILHRAKYEDQPWRLVRFTSAIVKRVSDSNWLDGIDLIIPMPGDPWRTWKRGYNPARIIANEIATMANVPLSHPKAFTRRGSKPQQSLSMDERSTRYADEVFTVNKMHLSIPTNRKCLLVDDIGTTGATLRAAAGALAASGFSVEAMVLSVGL